MKEKKKGKSKDENLTRKEWLIKAGKYSVFTAASMMLIIAPGNPAAAQSIVLGSDPSNTPSW